MSKFFLKEGEEKKGIYPFVTKNIIPGQDVVVKSAKHRRELMKEHGLTDALDWSRDSIRKKRINAESQRKEQRKKALEETFMKAKHGRIDLRSYALAQKKRDYMIRNGYIKP